jgi:protein-L-isoaspartate(D-aspartate) O-methyltransferase
VRRGDGYLGWPEAAPFDRIIVACSPEEVPQPLLEQLAEGGKLVIPLGTGYVQMLYVFSKTNGVVSRAAAGPTAFVPMSGRALAGSRETGARTKSVLVNGSFEELEPVIQAVTAWYQQRQMRVASVGAPDGRRYVVFENATPGRSAEASQAFGIDGREVAELTISGQVRGEGICRGAGMLERASVVLAFYDGDREVVGATAMGDWEGAFEWRRFEKRVAVPRSAREAILRIGLCGATGRLAMDDLRLTVE